jgi:hypothetical protein
MSELVERLRDLTKLLASDAPAKPVLVGAADRIEELERALREIARCDQWGGGNLATWEDTAKAAMNKARAVLEKKS